MARNFKDLSEREILALAIALEDEDGRIYGDFVEGLRESYPATAQMFEEMQEEESGHRRSLIETYRQRFGEHIPLIRRQDVKGFVDRRPVWLIRPLRIDAVRKQAEIMELETRRFYERAMQRVTDASTRKLLGDLAEAERKHSALAESLEMKHLTPETRAGGSCATPPVHAPDCPAGPGGFDGRLRFHSGATVRRSLRHAQELGRFSGRPRRLRRGRDFHGFRRGSL